MRNHMSVSSPPRFVKRSATHLVMLLTMISATLQSQSKDINGALTPATAQLKSARAAVDQVAFLVGQWKGSGWVAEGPGKRSEFQQTERVQKWANGTALIIQGEGSVPDSATGEMKVVFQAAAFLAYDTRTSTFSMLNAGGTGQTLLNTPEVSRNRLVWGYEAGGNQIRYVITLTADGRWHEIGEMTRDGGKRWDQFFFMELERTR